MLRLANKNKKQDIGDIDLDLIDADLYASQPRELLPPLKGQSTPQPSGEIQLFQPQAQPEDLNEPPAAAPPQPEQIASEYLQVEHEREGKALPAQPGITAAEPLNPGEKLLGAISSLLTPTPEVKRAQASNMIAISNELNLPVETVRKNYDQLNKSLGMVQGPKNVADLAMGMSVLPITAGVIAGALTNPVTTGLALAQFEGLSELENAFVSWRRKEPYQFHAGKGLKDLPSLEEANRFTRDFVDVLSFVGKGLVVTGVHRKAPKMAERFTKDILTEYRAPRKLYISPEKVADIFRTGEKISPEEMDLVKSLGLKGSEYKTAIERGLDVEVPAEKIVTVADKPYFSRLKQLLRIRPSEPQVMTTKAGEVAAQPSNAGLLEPGAQTFTDLARQPFTATTGTDAPVYDLPPKTRVGAFVRQIRAKMARDAAAAQQAELRKQQMKLFERQEKQTAKVLPGQPGQLPAGAPSATEAPEAAISGMKGNVAPEGEISRQGPETAAGGAELSGPWGRVEVDVGGETVTVQPRHRVGAKGWETTPGDVQTAWGEMTADVERVEREVRPQVEQLEAELDSFKGQRSKEAIKQRKEIKAQIARLKAHYEVLDEVYSDHLVEFQQKAAEEARRKARAAGVPEDRLDAFEEEFMFEISDERPFIEHNYNKTFQQIFDEVLPYHVPNETSFRELETEVRSAKSKLEKEPGNQSLKRSLRSLQEELEFHRQAVKEEKVKPKPELPRKQYKPGAKETVYLPDNTPVETEYAVVELDELIASHSEGFQVNPGYPQELQPRGRDRKGLRVQVDEIAQKLNPERIGESKSAGSGAPIVGPDFVVESGNGRVMALRKVYGRGGPKRLEYRRYLRKNAEKFGVSAEGLKGMKKPVLVRVRTSEVDRMEFTKKANQGETAQMSPVEQAQADAERMTTDDFSLFNPDESGNLTAASNRQFIKHFLAKLGSGEAAGYVTSEGGLTKKLVDRVQAAVFQKAYADESLLNLMAEETNPEIKNIINALTAASGEFVKAKGIEADPKIDVLTGHIVAAAKLLRQSRTGGQPVSMLLDQGGLFETIPGETAKIARFMDENIRSGKRIGEMLRETAGQIQGKLKRRGNIDIFGHQEDIDPGRLIDTVLKKLEAEGDLTRRTSETQDLFNDSGVRRDDVEGRGEGKPDGRGRAAPGSGNVQEKARQEVNSAEKKPSSRKAPTGTADTGRYAEIPSENEFARTSNGEFDFGEIPEEIAKAIGRKAAPIRVIHATIRHIESYPNRVLDIRRAGYKSTAEMLEDVSKNYTAIIQGKGGSLFLKKQNGGTWVSIIELVPDESGEFYTTKTAFAASRKGYLENKNPLWERAHSNQLPKESPSAVSGQSESDKNISQKTKDVKRRPAGEADTGGYADFITTKNGGVDFGEISEEMASAIGQKAAPIRLRQATVKYINSKPERVKEIKGAGFESIEDFVEDVTGGFSEIYRGRGRTFFLAKRDGRSGIAYIELRKSDAGEYYNVNNAFLVRERHFNKKNPLWKGTPTNLQHEQFPRRSLGQNEFSKESISPEKKNVKRRPAGEADTGGYADLGGYAGAEQQPGPGPAAMDLPEIVELAKELMGGRYPRISKKLRGLGVVGRFYGSGRGRIDLRADLFKDPLQGAKTLAHELGHLTDYLPDRTLKRGNILGRIASLKKYGKHYLENRPGAPGLLTDRDRVRIKAEARKLLKAEASELIDEEIRKELRLRPTTSWVSGARPHRESQKRKIRSFTFMSSGCRTGKRRA